jgi:hypothetical protein
MNGGLAEAIDPLPTLQREVFIFMRPGRLLSSSLLLATALTPCVAKTRSHTTKKPAAAKHSTGQRSIDDARATQIQTALVHSGYMSDPSGHWDPATETAMQKYQSDNGWQTKLMPDSRAIIKLGLGPSPAGPLPATSSISASQQPLHEAAENNLSQR